MNTLYDVFPDILVQFEDFQSDRVSNIIIMLFYFIMIDQSFIYGLLNIYLGIWAT